MKTKYLLMMRTLEEQRVHAISWVGIAGYGFITRVVVKERN